jgi:superfamily II DNA/RNA helicase
VYHGELENKQRESIRSHWKNGKIQIMIGINAFGMGINSSNVYLVIFSKAFYIKIFFRLKNNVGENLAIEIKTLVK